MKSIIKAKAKQPTDCRRLHHQDQVLSFRWYGVFVVFVLLDERET